MSIETEISKIANGIADYEKSREAEFQRQLADIEARKTQLVTERKIALSALDRLSDFEVKIGAYYQCPRCWIGKGERGDLHPIGNVTRRLERFRCQTCSEVFEFPF